MKTFCLFCLFCLFTITGSSAQSGNLTTDQSTKKVMTSLPVTLGNGGLEPSASCGTPPISAKELKKLKARIKEFGHTKSDGITYVPIKAHFVRPDNGDSSWEPTPTDFARMIARSSFELYDANMMFFTCGPVEIINSSEFHVFDQSSGASMNDLLTASNPVSDALNMYFAETVLDGDGNRLGGFAYFPFNSLLSSTSIMAMDNGFDWINYYTIPHELGHNFALPHTFQGTEEGPNDSNAEHVTRTGPNANCDEAGDGFCDTNADPEGNTSSCVYSDGDVDAFGDTYDPPVDNIMSYYGLCTDRFSPEQEVEMDGARALRASFTEANLSCTGDLVAMPTDLTATFIGGAVSLSWSDVATNETGYLIERAAPDAPTAFITLGEGGVAANIISFTDDTAEAGSDYIYRLRPLNGSPVTNGYSNTACTDDNNCGAVVTCDDGIQNGDETGIDCGGSSCLDCSSCQETGDILVTNTNASGPGSLRSAIECANSSSATDRRIRFDFEQVSSTYTIDVGDTPLPVITSLFLSIEGADGTAPFREIIIDGPNAGTDAYGLRVEAPGVNINNLTVSNFSAGGIFVGDQQDVSIFNLRLFNNRDGIEVKGAEVFITACRIGIDDGFNDRGNTRHGILADNVNTLILSDNFISFNGQDGIHIADAVNAISASRGVEIIGNRIGSESDFTDTGNGGYGVYVGDLARNVNIGGSLDAFDYIGFNQAGIFYGENTSEIQIYNTSLTCNDVPIERANAAANEAVQAPEITSYSLTSTMTLASGTAPVGSRVVVYIVNDFACTDAICQGGQFLEETTANGAGEWSIATTFLLSEESRITALATNQNGSTSTYSACRTVDSDCEATLACRGNVDVSLNDGCQQLLTINDVLVGDYGCLLPEDFEIVVNDGNPDNGPIVDEVGSYTYVVSCNGPDCDGNFATCSGTVNADLGDCVDCANFTVMAEVNFSPDVICPGEEADVVMTVSSSGIFPLTATLSGPGLAATVITFPTAGEQRLTVVPTSSGTYTLSGFQDLNDCNSGVSATGDIIVRPLVEVPSVTCEETTTSSVTINYDVDPNVQQYQVTINGGSVITTDGGSFTASGLPADTDVEFVFRGVGACNSNETTIVCRTDALQPTCDDGIQNGSETGVDCGGPDCAPCTIPCDETNFTYQLSISDDDICSGDPVTVTASVSGTGNPPYVLTFSEPGVAPYSLEIPGPANEIQLSRSPAASGFYQITAGTDAAGCTTSQTVVSEITVNTPLEELVIECGEATETSVTVMWNVDPAVNTYQVSVNGNSPVSATGGTFTVTDLGSAETVDFLVTAISGTDCPDLTAEISCTSLLDQCAGEPRITSPVTNTLCPFSGEVDLTLLEPEMADTDGGVTISWFEDAEGQVSIANPTFFAPASSPVTVFAQATLLPCTSEIIAVDLQIADDAPPVFENLPLSLCADGDLFFLPQPNDGTPGQWLLIGTGSVDFINPAEYVGQTLELAFDSAPGVCASPYEYTLTVEEVITPVFADIQRTICVDEGNYFLPETDDNNVNGFWSISANGSLPIDYVLDISDFGGQELTYHFITDNPCSSSFEFTFVVAEPVTVDFTFEHDTVCRNTLLELNYTGADAGAGEFFWSSVPAPVSPAGNVPNPELRWAETGEVEITLTVDNGCTTTIAKTIYVESCSDCEDASPVFTYCPPDQEVLLDLGTETAIDVSWPPPMAEACGVPFDLSADTSVTGLTADTTIVYLADNGDGQIAECSFSIDLIRTDSMTFYVDVDGIRATEDGVYMVPISVNNFDRGEGFQLSLSLSSMLGVGQFTGTVQPVNPLLNSGLQTELVDDQTINLIWVTDNPGPNTFPDGTRLFEVAVQLSGDDGACAQLSFIRDLPEVAMAFRAGEEVFPSTVGGEVCLPAFADIGGLITKADDSAVEGVSVRISRETGPAEETTDENGTYVLPQQLQGDTYTIAPYLDGDDRNGISIFDILAIRNMITGQINNSSPTTAYQYIAANVRPESCGVDITDLITEMQLLAGVLESFPDVPSWRFVPKAHELPTIELIRDGNEDWCEFPESIVLDPLAGNVADGDFVAVKMGDIDLNAEAPAPAGNRVVGFTDQAFQRGDTITIIPQLAEDIVTAELHWRYDGKVLLPIRSSVNAKLPVTPGDLVSDDGRHLRQVWTDLTGAPRLSFIALSDGWLSDQLSLTDESTGTDVPGELYALRAEAATTLPVNSDWRVEVAPNPFGAFLSVTISSQDAVTSVLTVFDVAGRRMVTQELDLAQGTQTVELGTSAWPAGVYYLRIAGAGGEQHRKVVKQ